MWTYVARRLVQTVPVILGISVVVFVGMHILPGDVAQMIAGDKATAQGLAAIREQLGLNDPLYTQYFRFVGHALRGDFGASLRTHNPALTVVAQAFPVTVQLALASLLVAVVAGIGVGVVSAVRHATWVDASTMVVALVGVSMPVFWTGLLLMILFGLYFPILPIAGVLDPRIALARVTGSPLLDSLLTWNVPAMKDSLLHLVLPAITLATVPMAMIARMTRSSVLEVLGQDYVRTARAKGLPERSVIWRHGLRAALIPVVTTIGLQFGLLLSGAILTETIFGIPGLGRLAVVSILYRDYTVVQALVLLTAILYVGVNLAVDVLYAFLDPRIKYA